MFKEFNRHQDLLIPASFSEVIDPGDVANIIAEVVEGLDLSPIIRRYDPLGQNAYHPRMLLALLFYAYSQGVFSSRKIAERVRYDVRFMFLAGRLRPDFRTIADFRKNHIDLLSGLFVQIVRLCRALGLIALKTVAIDGTKIKANAASRRTKAGDDLAAELAVQAQEVNHWLEAAEQTDEREAQETNTDLLPTGVSVESLKQLQALVKQAREKLQSGSAAVRVNMTDPDSREMKGVGPAYNAQLAVDSQSQIIVAADVTDEANETHQLTPMVEQLEANTSSQGQPKAVTADSGFSSAAACLELEQKPQLTAYVPTQRQVHRQRQGVGPYSKEQFGLDPATGVGRCPLGQPMRLLRRGVNKSGQGYYHFIGTACSGCPVRRECTRASYRSVVLLQAEAALKRMEARVDSPSGRAALRLRRQTVEPVIGILKEQLGFRRFHLRGSAKVKGEFALLCAAFDLKKLHRLLTGRSLAAAMAVLGQLFVALLSSWVDLLTNRGSTDAVLGSSGA
jgi:transposase